jgi:flagellar motor protein MotB
MAAKYGKKNAKSEVIVKKYEIVEGGHHAGAWKVAYADFVTAMMAFFLLMWLLNATTEDQRKGLADYFSPNSQLSHGSSGTGQPFGGHTAFDQGALVSDRGAVQITRASSRSLSERKMATTPFSPKRIALSPGRESEKDPRLTTKTSTTPTRSLWGRKKPVRHPALAAHRSLSAKPNRPVQEQLPRPRSQPKKPVRKRWPSSMPRTRSNRRYTPIQSWQTFPSNLPST